MCGVCGAADSVRVSSACCRSRRRRVLATSVQLVVAAGFARGRLVFPPPPIAADAVRGNRAWPHADDRWRSRCLVAGRGPAGARIVRRWRRWCFCFVYFVVVVALALFAPPPHKKQKGRGWCGCLLLLIRRADTS